VFQNDRLMPWRSALDNVVLAWKSSTPSGARPSGGAALAVAARPVRHENDYPHALSGVCASASRSRGLRVEPDILLCDEPFSSLDEMTARDLRAEFVRLVKQAGKTAVFITHQSRGDGRRDRIMCSTGRRGSPMSADG